MKDAICLKLVMLESSKHHGQPLHEWILRQAQQQGVDVPYFLQAGSCGATGGVL